MEDTPLGQKVILNIRPRYFAYHPEFEVVDGEYKELDQGVEILIDAKTKEVRKMPLPFSRKHQGIKSNPTLHNALRNPVLMNFRIGSKHRLVEYVGYASVLTYSDTGNVIFTFITRHQNYIKSGNKFFQSKGDIICLMLNHDRQSSLTVNGQLCYSNTKIIRTLEKITDFLFSQAYTSDNETFLLIKQLYTQHFYASFTPGEIVNGQRLPTYNSSLFNARLYRVKRNHKLNDLPWPSHLLANIYDASDDNTYVHNPSLVKKRRSLNRYLLLGNTKKAIDSCFYGNSYPASIRKILIKGGPFAYPERIYRLLLDLLEKKDINTVRSFISTNNGEPNPDVLMHHALLDVFLLGFNKYQILKNGKSICHDVIRMKSVLSDYGYEIPFNNNLRQYHDSLSMLYVKVSGLFSQVYRRAYAEVDTSQQFQMKQLPSDRYVLRSPYNALELHDVSIQMEHCISSYMMEFFYQQLEIVLVTDPNGLYLAAIEVLEGKYVVQAKLYDNHPIRNDQSLTVFVSEWAALNGFELSGVDFGLPESSGLAFLPKNPNRIKYIEKLSQSLEDKQYCLDT